MIIKWAHWPISQHMDGVTIGLASFIRPNATVDVEPHELVHQQQFRDDWLMPLKYLLSKSARYRYEVEAYKVSIEHGLPLQTAVRYIRTSYNLGYSDTEIEAALRAK